MLLKKMSRVTAFIAMMVIGAGTYMYEYSRTAQDYFTYYGNISTQDVFIHPERVAFLTFGYMERQRPMNFYNEMWCRPIGASDDGHTFVDSREGSYESFIFPNNLDPTNVVDLELNERLGWSDYGLVDRQRIQAIEEFVSWEIGGLHPLESSDCYINSKMSTRTPIFGLEKAIFVPDVGRFAYIVPDAE
jgi:hypothetical protein